MTEAETIERRQVTIKVNYQSVTFEKDDATGLQIKQAAIDQGVDIKLDFVLKRKVGDEFVRIKDDQTVELHEGEFFRALTPDDNS